MTTLRRQNLPGRFTMCCTLLLRCRYTVCAQPRLYGRAGPWRTRARCAFRGTDLIDLERFVARGLRRCTERRHRPGRGGRRCPGDSGRQGDLGCLGRDALHGAIISAARRGRCLVVKTSGFVHIACTTPRSRLTAAAFKGSRLSGRQARQHPAQGYRHRTRDCSRGTRDRGRRDAPANPGLVIAAGRLLLISRPGCGRRG